LLSGRLWLLHLIVNAVVLACFVGWLHIPESYWWQVMFTVLIAIVLAVTFLVLHAGTLNYFVEARENRVALRPPFQRALQHLPAIIVWAVIYYFIHAQVIRLHDYQYEFPGYLRSEFPAWLRRLISEPTMDSIYESFVAFLHWVVLPGLLLPLALLCADRNFRGLISLRTWGRMLRNLSYWIVLILASLIGVWCTGKLLDWRLDPKTATLHGEEAWLVFRLIIVYPLIIFSWLWVCSMLGRARIRADAAVEKAASV
jgi:hypothetical protein